jgi:hypothetical protein
MEVQVFEVKSPAGGSVAWGVSARLPLSITSRPCILSEDNPGAQLNYSRWAG